MHKRLLGIFLSFCMVLGYTPVVTWAAEHKHCLCGNDHEDIGDHDDEKITEFQAWTDDLAEEQNGSGKTAANSLPSVSGNYYLTGDVRLPKLPGATAPEDNTWYPPDNTILCLNGYDIIAEWTFTTVIIKENTTFTLTDCHTDAPGKITRTDPNWDGIHVEEKAVFNMYNGIISGHHSAMHGTAVNLNTRAKFHMYGGSICNNISSDGSAVYIINWATFHMYGGSISNNISVYGKGAGVSNNYHSSFYMHGGEISHNTINQVYTTSKGLEIPYYSSGAGVYNSSTATFYMYGGTISENNATETYGGGVYSGGDFYMYGGTISDNTAGIKGGGVFLDYERDEYGKQTGVSSMIIEDTITITENHLASGQDNNLHMAAPEMIEIASDLTGSAIGLTVPSDYDFSEGDFVVTTPYDEDYSNLFSSDYPDAYTVAYNGDKQIVLTAKNTYTITFKSGEADGADFSAILAEDSEYTLPSPDTLGFHAPAGKEFDTWDIGIPGKKITVTDNITVTALWKEVQAPIPTPPPAPIASFTISFDANGGTGTMSSITTTAAEFILPVCEFTAPSGKEFNKWDKGNVGDTIHISGNVTIKALWKKTTPEPIPEPEPAPEPAPPSGGGGGGGNYDYDGRKPYYPAKLVDPIENGTLTLDKDKEFSRRTITITAIPDPGYVLDHVVVRDVMGMAVYTTNQGNNVFTFQMPIGGVEIDAIFIPITAMPITPAVPGIIPLSDDSITPVTGNTGSQRVTLVLTVDKKEYLLNGQPMVNDVAPVIRSNRAFIPIRVVAQALGAEITWNPNTNSAVITRNGDVLLLTAEKSTAWVNGIPKTLDASAFIASSRTYQPIRFVSEYLGAQVQWDGTNRTITITD